MTVKLVIDSSAGLSAEQVAEFGITIVSLRVMTGEVDAPDSSPAELAQPVDSASPAAMAAGDAVVTADDATADDATADDATGSSAAPAAPTASTSAPSPTDCAAALRGAVAASGGDGVVAITLASGFSSTYQTMLAAAVDISGAPISVVDSQSVSMGMGFAVLSAAAAAASGADVDTVAAEATRVAACSVAMFCVPNLQALRRGGRVGVATALASQLSVVPILNLTGGSVSVRARVRTVSKARARMVDVALAEYALLHGGDPDRVAVLHSDAPEAAEELAKVLRGAVPGASSVVVQRISSVLATHIGSGATGIVLAPK